MSYAPPIRLVLDTDVIVAAMRSPTGASAELLRRADNGLVTLLLNVALALEYEAVCLRPDHLSAAGLASAEAMIFVDQVIAMAAPVVSRFRWRPRLRDPGDELVLETAVNGQAAAIVTFNRRDFVGAAQFGIAVRLPSEALRSLPP